MYILYYIIHTYYTFYYYYQISGEKKMLHGMFYLRQKYRNTLQKVILIFLKFIIGNH